MTALPSPRHDSALGILCLCAGLGLFSVQDLILKLLSGSYPLSQAMVFRSLTALPLLLLLAHRDGGLGTLFTPGTRAMIARGLVMFVAYAAYYLALPALPLATAVALYFSAPLFITLLSIPMLGETVGWRRGLAVLAGFGGVLIILRPGAGVFDIAALLPVLSGFCYAVSMISARRLGQRESAPAMAFWGNLVFLGIATAMALGFGGATAPDLHPSLAFLMRGWVWPTPLDATLMAGCGVIAALGLTLLTQAYRIADANAVTPFEYSAMLWGILWGWAFFAEWPDALAWTGIATIVAAGLFVLWRERVTRQSS
ncbi:DMT family transporter [Pseudotabrizicola sediminis]|uniref:DMT family transporter n=1 Tax=Pseudotabrizicola sediminis TaxID=2486418 RepID=A0ABY2KJD0_9RHOB|nr:DMT family transporter [Pseudotabrizicola sediminis]TGD42502.1 DMT family transporter [Pseudotabrizicola sediminis]TGD65079.1 DMT family transporter [Tabrizicola sp. WMC-M-20]